MNKLWVQKAREFKWHATGLVWLLLATATGYGVGWGEGRTLSAPTPPSMETARRAQAPDVALTAGPIPAKVASDVPARSSRELRIWEASPVLAATPDGKTKPLTPEFWKISGVFETPQGRMVIVEYSSPRASEYLKVGKTLPNGAKIVAVDQKSITVKTRVANQWKMIVLDFDVNNF